MEQLIAEITRLARKLERDIRELDMETNRSSRTAPAIQPNGSRLEQVPVGGLSPSANQPGQRSGPPAGLPELVRDLTPQEKRVFELCFQSGPLTYRELGRHLGVSHITAKNLVNRIFHEADKRKLFRKETRSGIVRVSLSRDMEREILNGRDSKEGSQYGADNVIRVKLPQP